MEKVYGYKERDLIDLAKLVKNRNGKNLTQIFKDYAIKSGKATGTVRNIYYALVKLSERDEQFTKEHLDGKPLTAGKIRPFEKEQEAWLIQTVDKARAQGRSVRSVINEMSNGDVKLALRYQNKYRSALTKQRENDKLNSGAIIDGVNFSKATVIKLKKEINGLIEKIALSLRKENSHLKSRIDFLEKENFRLNNIIYGNAVPSNVKYFSTPQGDVGAQIKA